MSTLKKVRWQLLLSFLVILLFSMDTHTSKAEEEEFEYGYCTNLKLEDIPYGDFSQFAIPQAELVCPEDNQDCNEQEKIWQPVFRITQVYNQPESEKWRYKGVWYWGHDGIDLHEKKVVNGKTISAAAGENAVIAIQGGKAVATMWGYQKKGWGYRTTIATRIPYSHQILTANYAHMRKKTLNYGKCANVQQGDILGREGATGWGTAAHTHVTVRIWDNIEKLKKALKKDDAVEEGESGYGLFQNGYARNNQAYLANYLSPYHLITGKFLEFECNDEGCPTWAKPHALAARRKGIDFGRYDGYFAVNTRDAEEPPVDLLKKGESARWFKVGRQFITTDSSNTFTDVSNGSIHFPYVETLISNGVLSPDADCNPGQAGKQFCPDTNRPRIELLKMVVMTYMRDEYYQWLNAAKEEGMDEYFDGAKNGQYFEDLYYDDGASCFEHWGTTFVLFAAFNQHMQLIDVSQSFRINDPINKLEAVKLMMLAREWYYTKNEEGTQYTVCDYHYCPIDQTCVVEMPGGYAEPVCIPMPACVPEEGEIIVCEYGGGITAGLQLCTGVTDQADWEIFVKDEVCTNQGAVWDCQPMPEGNSGMQVTNHFALINCDANVDMSGQKIDIITPYSDPINWAIAVEGSNGTESAAFTQPLSITFDPGEKTPLRIAGKVDGIAMIYLNPTENGCTPSCAQNEFCVNGICCQIGLTLCGSECIDIDNDLNNCGSCGLNCNPGETCESTMCVPGQPGCTDTYLASPTQACLVNNQQENITLCLQVQQVSGPAWKYKICRSGGNYTNSYAYTLNDSNYSVQFNDYIANQTYTCSPNWKSFTVSHIFGYGASNGAGITGEVTYPVGCNQSSCKYKTGTITIRKECQ